MIGQEAERCPLEEDRQRLDGQEARAGQSVRQLGVKGGHQEGGGSRATLSPPPSLPLIPNQ